MIRKMIHLLRGLLEDSKGDWKFSFALFSFGIAILGWWQNMSHFDSFLYGMTIINFCLAARHSADFWRRTENNRRIRRWKEK